MALGYLMPGNHTVQSLTRMSLTAPHLRVGPGGSATSPAMLESLFERLDWSPVSWVCDPWVGTGTVAWVFQERGYRVVTNDLDPRRDADSHEDAMQPAFYKRLQLAGLLVAMCLPRNTSGRRGVWLIVFANALVARRMLKAQYQSAAMFL